MTGSLNHTVLRQYWPSRSCPFTAWWLVYVPSVLMLHSLRTVYWRYRGIIYLNSTSRLVSVTEEHMFCIRYCWKVTYVCVYVCIYIYIYIYIHTHTRNFPAVPHREHMFCMRYCWKVKCVCICMYIYIYTYIHTHLTFQQYLIQNICSV